MPYGSTFQFVELAHLWSMMSREDTWVYDYYSTTFGIFNSVDQTHPFTSASLISVSGIDHFDSSRISLNSGNLAVELRLTRADNRGATIDMPSAVPAITAAGLPLKLKQHGIDLWCQYLRQYKLSSEPLVSSKLNDYAL
jgi:hypothetical protein